MGTFNFKGKYLIYADMICKTGLHIGGTEEGFEIGGLGNPVVRDPFTNYPYVPGSSLKGKMRSLVEWAIPMKHKGDRDTTCVQYMIEEATKESKKAKGNGKKKLEDVNPCNCGGCDVCAVFGCPAESGSSIGPTRLTVRDIMPICKTISKWKKTFEEGEYTEIKTENSIGRITSSAHPRPMERVPRGSIFRLEMIFDIYQDNDKDRLKMVFQALKLLEDSALGGSGTRGSGKVKFRNFKVIKRDVEYYKDGVEKNEEKGFELNGNDTPLQIIQHFSCIFNNS